MDALKGKLASMREELSAAEEREQIAKNASRKARERTSRAEDEANGVRRKLTLLQSRLEKVEADTDEKLDQLERVNKHFRDNETSRRQLERKEMREDDEIAKLESQQKSSQILAHEAEQQHREAVNKLQMLEAQTARVDARIRTAKRSEMYFEDRLNSAGKTAGNLAKSGEFKHAKCDEYEEKIRGLREKNERVLITAECLQRKANQLENALIPLRNETNEMKKLATQTKKELRGILDEVNTYH